MYEGRFEDRIEFSMINSPKSEITSVNKMGDINLYETEQLSVSVFETQNFPQSCISQRFTLE